MRKEVAGSVLLRYCSIAMLVFALVIALGYSTASQYFDGIKDTGPYAWVDAATGRHHAGDRHAAHVRKLLQRDDSDDDVDQRNAVRIVIPHRAARLS